MKDAVFIIPKPSLLQEAVAIIDDLNITPQNRDTQGDIYEYIIRKHTSPDMVQEGDEGKYYGLYGDKITDKNAWTLLWSSFYGYDFEPTMVRLSLMNMVLHGIATPPFKGSIDKGDINDHLTVGTTKTELLFVERMMNLLHHKKSCAKLNHRALSQPVDIALV